MIENTILFFVFGVALFASSSITLGSFLEILDRPRFRLRSLPLIFPCLMGMFFGLWLLLAATACSREAGRIQEKEKAIEAGVASYIFNADTGDSEFEYLKIKENNNE